MANLPGSWNALPDVYGPGDHEFYYNKTHLTIYWCSGNIILRKGTWHEAAIAIVNYVLRVQRRDPHKPPISEIIFGKLKIDINNLEMSLLYFPLPANVSSDLFSEKDYKQIKKEYEARLTELEKNFLILKENFDKVKNLMAFI